MPIIPPIRHSPVINRRTLRRNTSTTAAEGTGAKNQPAPRDRRRKSDRRQRQLGVRFERRQQIRRGRQNSSDETVGRHINTEA